jgi:hypothetical protein
MDNSKYKLKKIRKYLEEQQKLNNMYEKKQEKISEKLWKLNDIQSKLYEYNNCRRNSHIGIGVAALIASFFVTKNILDQELINAALISLGISSTCSFGTHGFLKHKIKKLKKENPEIDFENSNFDENEKKRQSLLEKQMEYSKKMSEINDMNAKCAYCLEKLDNNKNINSLKTCEILNENQTCNKEKPNEKPKQNILVMTIK